MNVEIKSASFKLTINGEPMEFELVRGGDIKSIVNWNHRPINADDIRRIEKVGEALVEAMGLLEEIE